MNTYLKLFISIVTCLTVGAVSGYFTANEIPNWYATLIKPSFNPPNWIFGPVWSTLYLLMAISWWLVWKSDIASSKKNKAMLIFAIQLILNFFWSIIFFSFHQPGFALIEIIIMLIFILFSIITFYPASKPAAYLLIPYLLWVSFASILNYAIWKLN